ncbi:MAG: hypothetical protein IPL26_00270 [Leptospiraceae bacterium]|nr:hypothetical protein [Leptospiraceae bacterium]
MEDENIYSRQTRKNRKTGHTEIVDIDVDRKYFIKRKSKIRECLLIEIFFEEKYEKGTVIYLDTLRKGIVFTDELHESSENI